MTISMALLGTSLVVSMLGMTMPAHAQDAATPQMVVQDILVTARRQEESLQTTPIAVTALGESALVRSQVVNVSDVQRTAPSVVISTGSPGAATFAYVAIRGQGNLQPILANDPEIGRAHV